MEGVTQHFRQREFKADLDLGKVTPIRGAVAIRRMTLLVILTAVNFLLCTFKLAASYVASYQKPLSLASLLDAA